MNEILFVPMTSIIIYDDLSDERWQIEWDDVVIAFFNWTAVDDEGDEKTFRQMTSKFVL